MIMRNLSNFIKGNRIDGHIHLFNHKESLKNPYHYPYSSCVGFMDLEYDTNNIDVIGSYKRYIENDYNGKDILLATGTTIDDIKYLLENYPMIKGIGELKCYDNYRNKPLPYKDINFVDDCCELAGLYGYPLYLHWELDNDKYIKQLANFVNVA